MRNSHLWSEWHIYYLPCDFSAIYNYKQPFLFFLYQFYGKMAIFDRKFLKMNGADVPAQGSRRLKFGTEIFQRKYICDRKLQNLKK